MSNHLDATDPADEHPITLRGPAELVDALPYLLGFRPTDSVVLVTLHGERARFGGRLRLGIPAGPDEWSPVAHLLAEYAVKAAQRRGTRPDGILVFLCQDPDGKAGESGRQVMERLQPFAQLLRTACGALDVPVLEALCVSGGRFWSYCCPDTRCCPPEGRETVLPGTSVMAAAAAYAGVRVRGSLREMERRLQPGSGACTPGQAKAFDVAAGAIVPEILGGGRASVAGRTLALTRDLMRRFDAAQGPPPSTAETEAAADALDDTLLVDDEVAALVLGLQDRETRDRAAAWTDEREAGAALRLWRALARRCAGVYVEYAAAPLVLAAWYAWAAGDEPGARVAVSRALTVDPHYRLARLLHEAYNQGIDARALRSCFEAQPRTGTQTQTPAQAQMLFAGAADGPAETTSAGQPTAADKAGEKTRTPRSARRGVLRRVRSRPKRPASQGGVAPTRNGCPGSGRVRRHSRPASDGRESAGGQSGA